MSNKIKFIKPDFKHEWEEALRYREFEDMGKDKWIDLAKNGQPIKYSEIKEKLSNVNLDFDDLAFDKKKRFEKHFESGEIEYPMVAKFNDGYSLIGGNTRLAGLIKNNIEPELWVVDGSMEKKEILKGGLADGMSLEDIAKKHKVDIKHIIEQVKMGVKVEREHTSDKNKIIEIVKDHLSEDPDYYTKLKKMESGEEDTNEMTGADSSGAFSSALSSPPIKRKINNINNDKSYLSETIESSGEYDVPLFGGTKGRKNPLSIGGEKTIKTRAKNIDKNKKFPKFGGPDAKFVKIKDKCKKFPYCNQDPNAIELMESPHMKEIISEISKESGIPYKELEKVVLNEIKRIFI